MKKLIVCQRKSLILALLLCILCSPALARPLAPTLEIADVKVAGVSAADEARSVIQVQWRVNAQQGANIKSFDIAIEVTYADGATEKLKNSANAAARSVRFEVATLHRVAGRPPAELKSFQASITAIFTETSIKQGLF